MNSNKNRVSTYDVRWTHADFELAAALKDATEVPEAPASLYRACHGAGRRAQLPGWWHRS